MAFRLTEAELKQRDQLLMELSSTGEALTQAVDEYNQACDEAWQEVDAAQQAYTATVQSAQAFVTQVHDGNQEQFDDKSETWQASDTGDAVSGWLEEWSVELDEPNLDKPDALERPDLEAMATLEQLPAEPS